jgi:hypothetical protein
MAIQKEKTLSNGVTGNYWRILSVFLDRQNLKAHGQIGLFIDKAASDAGKKPIGAIKNFSFALNMAEFLASANAITYIYSKIKAKAETEILYDIQGNLLEAPLLTDPDLAGGIDVL